jgi:hypothetical protein
MFWPSRETGDFKDNVLKVNVPRTDVNVTVAGVARQHPLGLADGSRWQRAGMDDDGRSDVAVGGSAVMSRPRQRSRGHCAAQPFLLGRTLFYMHVHGHGAPMDLARRVKPALDLIGRKPRPASPVSAGSSGGAALTITRLAQIAGHAGEQNGAVYKITVGREDLKLSEMGAPVHSRMGLNSWAAFVGTDANAAVAETSPCWHPRLPRSESVAAERHRYRGDPSSHAGHAAGSLLRPLLGHRHQTASPPLGSLSISSPSPTPR